MDMQNVKDLAITEGDVRTIHDSSGNLLWGRLAYDTKYEGDTFQQTYTGKNLLRNTLANVTKNGVTATRNADGSVTLTGTSSSGTVTWFTLAPNTWVVPAGTYTLSGGAGDGSGVGIYNDSFGAVASSMTKTLPNGSSGDWSIRISPNTPTNLTVYPMLESGSTATAYEPYVGGTASPNPDYPQDVQVVTGTQTVNVHGKNLFPVTNQDFTVNNVHFYTQNGTLFADGNSTGETYSNNTNWKNNFAFTLPAGTYTVSLDAAFTACTIKKMSDDSNLATLNGTTLKKATFTLSEETELYLGIYMYQLSLSNLRLPFQVEVGSDATTYEPYQVIKL